jgi:hypothetical protein
MQSFTAGVANPMHADMVAKLDGEAIIVGTVTGYLKALTGSYAGKYFRASDSSWQAAKSSAGAMVYAEEASWELDIAAAAWISGVRYKFLAAESGGLNIPYSDEIVEISAPVNVTIEPQVEQ